MRKNINEVKLVKDMSPAELGFFIYLNQSFISNYELSRKDISNLPFSKLYEIACDLENKISSQGVN